MEFESLKRDKGVAGLTILLSLITMLFVIGLLVMIFALMGGEIKDSESVKWASDGSADNETYAFADDGATSLTGCSGKTEGALVGISLVVNGSGGEEIDATNFTFVTTDCLVTPSSDSEYNATDIKVTYTYKFAGTSYTVMNDTSSGIASVTNWYPIFIVIGAMVVLILLTVIIITAIRGSGLMVGSDGGGNVGGA